MSISIPAPATNDVTVTFTAGNVRFGVPSVQFTAKDGVTAYTVAIHATNYGPDLIQFAISGTDAAWYEEIGDVSPAPPLPPSPNHPSHITLSLG